MLLIVTTISREYRNDVRVDRFRATQLSLMRSEEKSLVSFIRLIYSLDHDVWMKFDGA